MEYINMKTLAWQ